MAKSRNAPALYELMGSGTRTPVSPVVRPAKPTKQPKPPKPEKVRPKRRSLDDAGPPPDPAPADPVSEERFLGLRPGSVIRVPVGYIFFALAIFIGAVVGAYIIGHQQAENAFTAQRELEAARDLPVETLGDLPVNRGLIPADPRPATTSANRSATVSAGTSAAGRAYGPDDAEPRQLGMNYYILASLPEAEADKAARFLAERGIDTLRTAPSRSGLCAVIALEAFPPNTLGSDRAQEFQQSIKRLGRLFRREHDGANDFSGMYAKKHR